MLQNCNFWHKLIRISDHRNHREVGFLIERELNDLGSVIRRRGGKLVFRKITLFYFRFAIAIL